MCFRSGGHERGDTSAVQARLSDCNCLAIRQAARHVTQFYDQLFAPVGLRATQFAILSRLRREGPMTINALAARWSWTARLWAATSCRCSATG